MIGYDIAEKTIYRYIEEEIDNPPIEDEEAFKRACDMEWAARDLLLYLKEYWNENFYFELIADYIEDCRYRTWKYQEDSMGAVYKTAKETAEDILRYFV